MTESLGVMGEMGWRNVGEDEWCIERANVKVGTVKVQDEVKIETSEAWRGLPL